MTVLRADDSQTCNTFDNSTAVVPETKLLQFTNGGSITIPAASVVSISINLTE